MSWMASTEVLAIEIDLNLPASRVIRVLDRIAAWRGYPMMIRLDNGPANSFRCPACWAENKGFSRFCLQNAERSRAKSPINGSGNTRRTLHESLGDMTRGGIRFTKQSPAIPGNEMARMESFASASPQHVIYTDKYWPVGTRIKLPLPTHGQTFLST